MQRRALLRSAALSFALLATTRRLPAQSDSVTRPFRNSDHPRFRGPFPILSTPFTKDGAVDFEVLARSARFMDWCGSQGMIWPQSNDSIDLLTQDEKLEGMEVLSRASANLKTTALCLGVQGRDTDEMLVFARHAKKLAPLAVISRPPDTGTTQEELRRYWRALAQVITDRPVMIQTTARTGGIAPSTALLIELAREFPNFGFVKEESNPVIARTRELLASPAIRSVFSARGAYGWLYESRLGTEGLVTERSAYADVLAAIWRLMRSGTEPSKLKDAYARLLLMLNLEHTHPGNLRGYSLHLLNLRGVFNNMVSREYGPGGSTPDKPRIGNLSLSQEEITEIEWRFEELRPFLRPGSFQG